MTRRAPRPGRWLAGGMAPGAGGVDPLRRNRDFLALQAGQLLSSAGTAFSGLAYPLLVLALSHSPAQAGLVTFALFLPAGVFALPAGLAADRYPRKRVMITADAVRAAALACLAAAVLTGSASVPVILGVAFADGTGSAFFRAARAGALRAVVPAAQLPAAVSVEEARRSTVRLAGPPLGGVLFALGRALPFALDAVSYVCSALSLLVMRTPFEQAAGRDSAPLRARFAEGFAFVWGHPFLRTSAFLYGIGNFLYPGIVLLVIIAGTRQGLSPGEIGALTAAVGAGTLIGSLISGYVRRVLPVRQILLVEFWTWAGCWAYLIWPDVGVLVAVIVLFGIAAPITDSVVVSLRLAITPDHLLGRAESVRNSLALLIAPLGPLAAGFLADSASVATAVGFFAAVALALQAWGTLSPSIRRAPSLATLATPGTRTSEPAAGG